MPQYKVKSIKDTNPKLWLKLNKTLQLFPLQLSASEQDTEIKFFMKGNVQVRQTFKSGQPPTADEMKNEYAVSTIPLALEHALQNYKSIAQYISKTHKERLRVRPKSLFEFEGKPTQFLNNEALPFDRIPIGKLPLPPPKKNLPIIEAYSRRRVILNLLEICHIFGAVAFQSNNELEELLRFEPQKKNSNFLKVLRIEPCFLQTSLGNSILQRFSLWDRKEIDTLGIALKPQSKAKIESELDSSFHRTISKALLLLFAIHPEVKELKIRETIELLSGTELKNLIEGFDENEFGRLRKRLFG